MGESEAADSEVEIPWMDEPLPVAEAVEVIARAFDEEADDAEELIDRVERLEGRLDEMESRLDDVETDASSEVEESDIIGRIEALERCVAASTDGTAVSCPSCGSDDRVLKSGVAAAVLVRKEALPDNVGALNEESHLCLSCRTAFTPCDIDGGDRGARG